LRDGLWAWFTGYDIQFNFDDVRKAGTPLLTKGGRASGPDPLEKMLAFCRAKILSRQGKRLRPIDAHDMMCAIGQGAVSGGVRRTAMISLFDSDDVAMLYAKDGDFERANSQRWNANNTVVTVMDDPIVFAEQFLSMLKGGRGEPGIFNPQAALATMPERRLIGSDFGTNPCAEILLRSAQFCNLTSVVIRAGDQYQDLHDKVQMATILGTIQSLATNFPGLRPQWKTNCEEERLLGVSLDGQMDNAANMTDSVLWSCRQEAVRTNRQYAQILGINQSAAVTCVKPSGNSSQLLNAASGLHTRWAPYYIRNVRLSATSPLAHVLKDAGAPMSPENGDDPENPRTWVVSFPVKTPDGAVTRNDRSAVEQCEWWLKNKIQYTEHNPSVTITYLEEEVVELMAWVWKHRDKVGGMAFLPAFDAKYDQLPYVEITESEYQKRVSEFPDVDWAKVWRYETQDMSTASTTLACEGPICLLDEGAA
jgi:ribonucleoside-diphosphate reductase alpha chain